jgi:hypothetical protein
MGSGIREVFKESVSAVTATAPADLTPGTLRFESDEIYQYMYNGTETQINPGYMVRQSGQSGYTITVTSTAMLSIPVGVVKHATLTTGAYGWVLKQGTGKMVATANDDFAIGDGVALGDNGVFANPARYANVNNSTTHISGIKNIGVVGIAQSAIASGGSGIGYFRFL